MRHTAGAVVLGVAALTLSSYLEVPMRPVPLTMQTLAVTLVGAFCGARLGAAIVILWLVAGASGLPVLAGGASGPRHFQGATGGFLVSFPFAAALVGWLMARGWSTSPARAFSAMLLGHTVCLAIGAAWLATAIGAAPAATRGLLPFLPGAVIKSALGAAAVVVGTAFGARRRHPTNGRAR